MKPFFESDSINAYYAAVIPFSSVLTMSIQSPTNIIFRLKDYNTSNFNISYHTPAKCQSDIDNYKAYLEDQYHANHLN